MVWERHAHLKIPFEWHPSAIMAGEVSVFGLSAVESCPVEWPHRIKRDVRYFWSILTWSILNEARENMEGSFTIAKGDQFIDDNFLYILNFSLNIFSKKVWSKVIDNKLSVLHTKLYVVICLNMLHRFFFFCPPGTRRKPKRPFVSAYQGRGRDTDFLKTNPSQD